MNIRTIDWNDAREVDEFMEELDGYRAHMHAASQFGTDGIGAFIGDGNGVPSIDAVVRQLDGCVRRIHDAACDAAESPLYDIYCACEENHPDGNDSTGLGELVESMLRTYEPESASDVRDAECAKMNELIDEFCDTLKDAVRTVGQAYGHIMYTGTQFKDAVM